MITEGFNPPITMEDVIFLLNYIKNAAPHSIEEIPRARQAAFHARAAQQDRRVQDPQTIEANCLRDRGLSAPDFDTFAFEWLSGNGRRLADAYARSFPNHDITKHPEWSKLFPPVQVPTVSDKQDLSQTCDHGAGFGNAVENKEVERVAIIVVTNYYEKAGWVVRSVESDRCGFDLECCKNTSVENVEVKGISGTVQCFIITAGEVECARNDANFVLMVVTSALSTSPVITRYSGLEFLGRFQLMAVQYKAVVRQ